MRYQDRKIRNSLRYKIKMWFYYLTFNDIRKGIKNTVFFIIDMFIVILGFLMLFVLPAFFH